MSHLSRRIPFLLYGLVLLLLAWTGEGLFALIDGEGTLKKKSGVFQRVPATSGLAPQTESLDDYVAIKPDRFCGLENEKPATPRESSFKIRKTGFQAVYILRGTLVHSNPALSRAFIEVPGVSAQQAFHAGEEVHGAKILTIEKDRVALQKSDEIIRLAMNIDQVAPGRFKESVPQRETDRNARYASSDNRRRNDRTHEREKVDKRSRSNDDADAQLQRLPKVYREMLQGASPQEREALLNMDIKERMKALRDMYQAYKQARKKKSYK